MSFPFSHGKERKNIHRFTYESEHKQSDARQMTEETNARDLFFCLRPPGTKKKSSFLMVFLALYISLLSHTHSERAHKLVLFSVPLNRLPDPLQLEAGVAPDADGR